MPCKYGGPCESRNKSGDLFKSPVAYGSKVGKYTGTINKQTALERQGYSMTTRYGQAIKDREGLIAYLNRRELLRGPSAYYQTQIDYLKQEIAEIKAQQKAETDRNAQVTQLITNNAGRMVPASIFDVGTQTPNTPVKPESTQTEEQGIEGEAPQPSANPEEETEEESESESSEDEEKTNKQLVVISYFQNTEPDKPHKDIEKEVMDLSDEDLDAYYDMAQQSNFEPPGFKTMKESLPQ